MAFVDAMRAATIRLHTREQLAGRPDAGGTPPTLRGFVRYAAEQRALHGALRRTFPVRTPVDYARALDADLARLELPAAPGRSEYAAYLETLPVARLGCHWYNLVFAHLVGGNRAIAASAADVLPPGWLAASEFYAPAPPEDVRAMRGAFEEEARRWTPGEREACLAETPEAFRRASLVNATMRLP